LKGFPYKNVKRLVLTVLLMLKAMMALTVLTVLKVLVDSSRERAPAIIMLRDAVLLSLCRKEEKEWAAVCTGKAGDGHESWSRRSQFQHISVAFQSCIVFVLMSLYCISFDVFVLHLFV
jgi:hypothetical protein